MNKLFTIALLLLTTVIVSGQVTAVDERSPFSNQKSEMYDAFTILNANDAHLEDRLDSLNPLGTMGTVALDSLADLSATEVEILDGATLSTTELNYVKGVTSDIQTQINAQEAELNNSAGLAAALSDETGTVLAVFSTSPTLVTPNLGTPSTLVGTNISGTGASFTAGAVTGFTPASGSLTLAGADAITLNSSATTSVTLPTSGTLATTAITDLLAPLAAPTFTGLATFDSSITMGTFGDATQTVLSESSVNTNAHLGIYPMINFAATGGKTFAGALSRLLLITTPQTNDATMVGMQSQLRVKDVSLANGVHAGLWAYAEQSGTTVLSGNGTFNALHATIESASTFSCGATEQVTGITVDCSLNAGASIDAGANFSAIYVKSNGLDWQTGLKISGVDSADIVLTGGAIFNNIRNTDTLEITEDAVSIHGALYVTGDISSGGTTSDFAITDYQPPLLDYWAKTQELNKLPAFEGVDRMKLVPYINGVEEAAERNLRYIVELENRIRELEKILQE